MGTPSASLVSAVPGAPVERPGVIIVAGVGCCGQTAECQCPCACRQHPRPSGGVVSHYRYCDDCANGWHLEPLAIRAARSFGQLPPSHRGRRTGPYDRVMHLLPPPTGPRLVEGRRRA